MEANNMTDEELKIDGGGWGVTAKWWYYERAAQWRCSLSAWEKYEEGGRASLNESQAAELSAFLESPPGTDE